MKEGIHPTYHPVVFVDASSGDEIVSRSTMTSGEKRSINGVDHYVVSMDMTAYTHPAVIAAAIGGVLRAAGGR